MDDDAAGQGSRRGLGIGLALGLAVLLMLPFAASPLVLPWGRDQGIYAFSAWQVLAGHVPYTDIFIFKPPGTVYVHVLSQALFGSSMLAIRLLDMLWSLATGAAIFGLVLRATRRPLAGTFAAVVFTWSAADLSYWSQGQTDAWANLPYALALLLVLAEPPRRWRPWLALAAGVVFGGAFWLKYTTGGLLPFLMLVPLLRDGLRDRAAWLSAGAVLAGFTGAVLGVLGMLAAGGALSEFFAIQRDIVVPYTGVTGAADGVQRRSLWTFFAATERFGVAQLSLWAVGVVGVLGLVGARIRSWTLQDREGPLFDGRSLAALAALAWTLSGLLSGFVQGKFWMYQLMTTVGGGAMLSAIGLWTLSSGIGGRWAVALAVPWLLWAWDGRFPHRLELLQGYLTGQYDLEGLYSRGNYRNGGFDSRQARRVARVLARRTDPDSRIFIWGYDPMIYVLAGRRPVSRFPYHYAQIVPWGPDHYDDELFTALQTDPPAAFVVATDDSVSVVTKVKADSDELLERWPELHAWVQAEYREVEQVGRYAVWERRE